MDGKAIGIDLGTTYSCVAVWKDGKIELVANEMGNRITPSYVSFTETERYIGESALKIVSRNPENTVYDSKRLIGRAYDDEKIKKDQKRWPFTVVDEGGLPKVEVEWRGETKRFAPEQISAMLLEKMKTMAEEFLGHEVKDAVITVPAQFNDFQRAATKHAGEIAGLNVIRILNEPTAAALAFGYYKKFTEDRNVVVYDLGGGTFDVTVLRITAEGIFEVQSTHGHTHLGGEDFDNRLVDYFTAEFKEKYKKDLAVNARSVRKLRTECERAKKILSTNEEAAVSIESLFEGLDFDSKITRARFEEMCEGYFKKTIRTMEKALKDSGLNKDAIDDIVLVGGSTRIPRVLAMLSEFFPGKTLTRSINADESVAYGAAVQAGIMSDNEDLKHMLLIDVTPLSLGIEVGTHGAMSTIIQRNSRIPVTASKDYVNSVDFQKKIPINVYEGERPLVSENHLIGSFILEDFTPAPKNMAKLVVEFKVDADGILEVTATDVTKEKSEKVTIQKESRRLAPKDVQEMLAEAQRFQEEDKITRTKIKMRNELDSFLLEVRRRAAQTDVLTIEQKECVIVICKETMSWIDLNRLAEIEELEHKRSEVKEQLQPYMAQLNLPQFIELL